MFNSFCDSSELLQRWASSIAAHFLPRQPTGHISVKAVSWTLVKKYAEPGAGLVGHKISIIQPSDRSIVAEKFTDKDGYAIFDLPAGAYIVLGIGAEPQKVTLQPAQTVNLKLIVR